MSGKITIQKIANMAGVSRGTVDRVLNNRSYVKEDVRERVLAVIRETGYMSPKEAKLMKQTAATGSVRLGVLLPAQNFGSQFLEEVEKGIRQAQTELEDHGVRIFVRKCTTEMPSEAISLLEEMRHMGAMGFSICALNAGSLTEYMQKMKEEGIPSVTFNSDLPDSGRLLFFGQDIRKTGRLAAELLTKCLRQDERILAVVGNLKFDGHQQRLLGFREKLEELNFPSDRLEIAESFNDYTTTVEVVRAAIDRHSDLRGIYMANLSVTGCAEAIRTKGKQGIIRVVCHDVNPGISHLLREGLIDYTIPQDFVYQGYEPLIRLAAYFRGKPILDPVRENRPVQILCRENLL